MKLLRRIQSRRGISMTEYLIILSIVAIAAIAVVGLFGKQIKQTFYRNTSTLSGTDTSGGDTTAVSDSKTEAGKTDTMKDFDDKKNN